MIYVDSNEQEKSYIGLYDKYYKKIYNYLFRKTFDKELAEDLTSNTFLKALDVIKRKNPQIKNFSAWIYKIATNEFLMHHRYKKGKDKISLDDEQNNLREIMNGRTEKFFETHTQYIAVREVLKKLKPDDAALIELHFFEHKTYTELSEILNVKEVTLRSRIHRILKKLNKMLD